jgi:hypothetical protein
MKPQNNKRLTVPSPGTVSVTVRKPAQFRRTIHKDPATYEAGTLASLGFSNKMIQVATGLKAHAISYRLRQAEVRISDYRNGTNNVARHILSHARKFAQEEFTQQLREKLGL